MDGIAGAICCEISPWGQAIEDSSNLAVPEPGLVTGGGDPLNVRRKYGAVAVQKRSGEGIVIRRYRVIVEPFPARERRPNPQQGIRTFIGSREGKEVKGRL